MPPIPSCQDSGPVNDGPREELTAILGKFVQATGERLVNGRSGSEVERRGSTGGRSDGVICAISRKNADTR